jgi:lipopolysaccharide export system protein LptA
MRTSRRPLLQAVFAVILSGSPSLWAASTLTYSGDSMSTVLAEGNKRAVLAGNARVETEDTVIHADRIELYGKDFIYAMCTGNVKAVNANKGTELTSRRLFYDRQEKIARISGDAMMVDLKNELVVKGGFIEDREKEDLTIVQIGVRILKKDMVCRSEFARYYKKKKTLELSGLPWVSRKGDEYRAVRIIVNLDTEDIDLEGDVKGEISAGTPEKKEQDSPAAGGAPPAETAPPATDAGSGPGGPAPRKGGGGGN